MRDVRLSALCRSMSPTRPSAICSASSRVAQGPDRAVSEVMRDKRLFADGRPRHVQQVAMVGEDQNLALLGEASQGPEDVSHTPVVGSDKRIVQHERHLWVCRPTDIQRR